MINILYKGKVIYKDLSEEECSDILFELAEHSYEGKIDANEIKLEETDG